MALALYPWQQPLAESLNRMRSEMPNGLLIYGPRGIGTFDLAERLPKAFCVSRRRRTARPAVTAAAAD